MHHHSRNLLRGHSWRYQGNARKQRNFVSRARCVDPEDTGCLCGRREGFSLRRRCRNRHTRSNRHLSGQVALLVQIPQIADFAVDRSPRVPTRARRSAACDRVLLTLHSLAVVMSDGGKKQKDSATCGRFHTAGKPCNYRLPRPLCCASARAPAS
jgi:hypothetical protein